MFGRLYGMLAKEFAQVLREPTMLFIIVWLYTAELLMCTMALGFDVKNLQLGVVDHDRSAASRELVREFTSADTFVLAGSFASMREARGELQRGRLDAVVELPPNLGARIAGGREAAFGVVVDGSNANVASRARAYVIEMTSRFARDRLAATHLAHPVVEPAVRVWYNPDLTNTRFMALAMLAQAGLMLAVVLPAAAMVREKQLGTIEQLRVTPIRAHELFIAKVTPTIVICLGATFPSLLVTRFMGVPMHGDVATLLVFAFIFLLSGVSIGVFVATITKTLQQAMLVSFFGLFPLMFLSGSVAPIESMPDWLQTATQASPMRHYLEIVSGLFLKGAGMGELWPHALALGLITLVMFSSAWLLFRRQW